jgi:hypothetical protein
MEEVSFIGCQASFEDLNSIEKLPGKLRNLSPKGNDNLNDT